LIEEDPPTKFEVMEFYSALDADKDGQLSYDELKYLIESLVEKVVKKDYESGVVHERMMKKVFN